MIIPDTLKAELNSRHDLLAGRAAAEDEVVTRAKAAMMEAMKAWLATIAELETVEAALAALAKLEKTT